MCWIEFGLEGVVKLRFIQIYFNRSLFFTESNISAVHLINCVQHKIYFVGDYQSSPLIGECRTRLAFGGVEKLLLPVFLGKSFIYKVVRSVLLTERKNLPYRSLLVLILMVHEASNAAEKDKSDNCQQIAESLALFVTPTLNDPEHITVALQVVLTTMCQMTLLASTKVVGLKEVVFHERVIKKYPCMTTKLIMDVYPGRTFHNTIANFVRLT